MDKTHFAQLVQGVQEMNRHIRDSAISKPAAAKVAAGKTAACKAAVEQAVPDVRVIREAAQISQSQFAKLIGVNLRTLQNWEQHRTRPTGPARALLKIVAVNPKAIEALHV